MTHILVIIALCLLFHQKKCFDPNIWFKQRFTPNYSDFRQEYTDLDTSTSASSSSNLDIIYTRISAHPKTVTHVTQVFVTYRNRAQEINISFKPQFTLEEFWVSRNTGHVTGLNSLCSKGKREILHPESRTYQVILGKSVVHIHNSCCLSSIELEILCQCSLPLLMIIPTNVQKLPV